MKFLVGVGLGLGLGLLVLGSLGAQALAPLPAVEVTPPPGDYASPTAVRVQAPDGVTLRYRFVETPSAQTFPWPGTLVLEALAGETRTYTLRLTTDLASGEAQTRDYVYRIRRPAEALPTVQPAPGTFTSGLSVRADLPPGWTASLDGRPLSFPFDLDAAPGLRRSATVHLRGPGAQDLEWSWTVDRRDQDAASLEVLSPIPGTWANPQPLAVAVRGADRVLWTWGDRFDEATAREYRGPVPLDRTGAQTLTVAARDRFDGSWITKTVAWTSGTAAPPVEAWPPSGSRRSALDLPPAPGWALSWDEGRSWAPAAGVHEAVPTLGRKVLSLQARSGAGLWRFTYWLDGRLLAAPTLEFTGGWNPQVTFSGASEVLHRLVWTRADGQLVEEPAGLWGPLGSWKVPDGVVGARVTSLGPSGLEGTPVALGFGETGWSTPLWEPWDLKGPQADRSVLPLGGRILPRAGFRAVYEVSDRPDVPEATDRSALLEGLFLPSVPPGADRTFYVRFAWRDARGLVGPSTSAVAVRVDRVPPRPPEVVEVGSTLVLKAAEGEEEGTQLAWAVTSQRVADPSSLTFQPYRAPLDGALLRAGTQGPLWLHAQAQDRAGNVGPVRLNVAVAGAASADPGVVQVDPDPAVGEIPVADGGVYPWAQFRLRTSDPDRSLWVGVADQGGPVPSDWAARVQPWSGLLSRAVGRGERRTFLVYWNAKTADGWAWTAPKTLTLTLDQGPPGPVVISASWPTGPRSGPWTLGLQPGRPGDRLLYTASLDGSEPADPRVAGAPWPGTVTWDPVPSGRREVRVRVAAVSVSGLAVETPLGAPVVLDRTPPAPVTPALEPFTYRTGPLVVALPRAEGPVRYSLTSDGTPPQVPTDQSPALGPQGLTLEGLAGQSILYRFRWRPFSPSGVAGEAGDSFAVLIDRTATGPSTPVDPETSVPLPRILGLPAQGLSKDPVTLQAEWSPGVLRFEAREGLGTGRAVTALSPIWTPNLVLDPGVGTDRSWEVAVRGFSPDGQPLTPEVRVKVRVDRSVPALPSLRLQADPRRPEAALGLPSEANPEETLVYRWGWESFPEGRGQSSWVEAGAEAPVFTAPEGALTRLRVQAFLRDEAGNEGPTAEAAVLLDRNVVYLAPGATGDGTRAQPLGDLAQGLDLARRTGRTALFLAAGTYPAARTLDLDGLEVYGGWSTTDWEQTSDPGRSLWKAARPFVGDHFLESGARAWSLDRVDLDTGTAVLRALADVDGAQVSVRRSAWRVRQTATVWTQTGGELLWAGVTGDYEAEAQGSFLSLQGAHLRVQDLRLLATRNQGGVLFSLQGSQVLFQNLTVASKLGVGLDAVLRAEDCELTLDGGQIEAGEGAARATGFLLRRSQLTAWDLDLRLGASQSNTGLQALASHLDLRRVQLRLTAGSEYNQGLTLDRTESLVHDLVLEVRSGAWQGGLSVDGGSLELGSAQIRLAGGGQRAWGAQFLGSGLVHLTDVDWFLAVPTPGEAWRADPAWAPGSSEVHSTAKGW